MAELSRQFIDALHRLERDGDPSALVDLFHDDCTVSNVVTRRSFAGKRGAREFWNEYRGFFSDLESEFRNVVTSGDRIAFEWVSHGTNVHGLDVTYEGVSMLEIRDGKVLRFHAYFDPAHLSHQIAHAAPPY